MEGSETLFCSSEFPWAHERIYSKFIDIVVMCPRKSLLALLYRICTHRNSYWPWTHTICVWFGISYSISWKQPETVLGHIHVYHLLLLPLPSDVSHSDLGLYCYVAVVNHHWFKVGILTSPFPFLNLLPACCVK